MRFSILCMPGTTAKYRYGLVRVVHDVVLMTTGRYVVLRRGLGLPYETTTSADATITSNARAFNNADTCGSIQWTHYETYANSLLVCGVAETRFIFSLEYSRAPVGSNDRLLFRHP